MSFKKIEQVCVAFMPGPFVAPWFWLIHSRAAFKRNENVATFSETSCDERKREVDGWD